MPRQMIDVYASVRAQEWASSPDFVVGVRNAKDDEPAEIALYGIIGDPWEQMDAKSVAQFLRANKGKAVNVRINSPGGLAYDGITIHNALLAHNGPVVTTIEGMAGSAASIVAMAGNPVRIYENAQLFIHRAMLMAIGNVDVMDEAKEFLSKMDDALARTYKAKTGRAIDKIHAWMRGKVDGTVFSAREALAEKFVDEVVSLKQSDKATNSVDWKQQLKAEAAKRLRGMEAVRAERIRSRREMFTPAE